MKTLKKFSKITLASLALTVTLLLNSIGAQAVTVSATPNSTWSKVTISYSNCYGSTIFYLSGYERHSETGQYYYYSKNKTFSSSGTISTTFSANIGYKFVSYYSGKYLTASIRVNGNSVASLVVTN